MANLIRIGGGADIAYEEAGTQMTIALYFNFGAIKNIMAIVYDD